MMKKNISIFISLFFLAITLNSYAAVKVVECEDEQGNRSFQKTCPPGSMMIGERKINTGTGSTENIKSDNVNIQATLYSVSECDACEQVKDFLSSKGVSITEKDASTDVDIQKELTDLSGALKVPTTIIGDEILTGYNHSEFMRVIKEAGYSEDAATKEEQNDNSEIKKDS
jgi:glutaredoxin